MYCWSFVVLSVAFSVGLFKKETRRAKDVDYKEISVLQNYKLIWHVLKLPGIKVLATALMTTMVNIIN